LIVLHNWWILFFFLLLATCSIGLKKFSFFNMLLTPCLVAKYVMLLRLLLLDISLIKNPLVLVSALFGILVELPLWSLDSFQFLIRSYLEKFGLLSMTPKDSRHSTIFSSLQCTASDGLQCRLLTCHSYLV